MNSPADAAESHQTEKVCKAQARSLQRESWRKTEQHDQDTKMSGNCWRICLIQFGYVFNLFQMNKKKIITNT